MEIVSLDRVRKIFNGKTVVRDISLSITSGQMIGVLGPNGAGKTTTIRMIMGILFPDAGQIRLFGQSSLIKARDKIGYLPEERGWICPGELCCFLFLFFSSS